MTFTGEWFVSLGAGPGGSTFELRSEPERPKPRVATRAGTTLVFDGVLYGREELARHLGVRSADNEAELLLDAWLIDRDRLLERLRGRFSLLRWDADRRSLAAVRDPLGVHPLFFAHGLDGTLVSPFMDLLVRQPGLDRSVDPVVTAGQMITGEGSAPTETPFRGLHRVPPGHYLQVGRGDRSIHRYWEPTPRPVGDPNEAFESAIETSVRRCHSTAGRLGVFLSGGIDSASVALAATRAAPRDRAMPLAISLFAGDPGSSEEETQKAVASTLELELLGGTAESLVSPDELLPRALRLTADVPYLPSPTAAAWDVLLAEARSAGCTTVLTGDGGDEWLLPFPSWLTQRLARLDVEAAILMIKAAPYSNPGVSTLGAIRQLLWQAGLRSLLRGAAMRLGNAIAPSKVRRSRARRIARSIPDWLLPEPEQRSAYARWALDQRIEGTTASLHLLQKRFVPTAAFSSAVTEELFHTSRRLGVEILCPYLDVDVIEVLLGIPEKELVSRGRAKAVARDYVSSRLPFADSWPAKTFGDPELARILRGRGSDTWRRSGDLSTLEEIGIVDPRPLESARVDASVGLPLLWDLVTLNSWLSDRILRPETETWPGRQADAKRIDKEEQGGPAQSSLAPDEA